MLTVTRYRHHTGRLTKPITFAVVSDLHNEPYGEILKKLDGADALLVPGDVSDRYHQVCDQGVAFLREAAKRLPTFFAPGNHETRQRTYHELMSAIEAANVTVLVNRCVSFDECVIGGWYSPAVVHEPDMLNAFEREQCVKVLLCHKPEDYIREMRGRDIDLVVAGHAHGGQIRLWGHGLYAPGQGVLPKYTRGVVDGRLYISAGVGNPVNIPRWGNPPEMLWITVD